MSERTETNGANPRFRMGPLAQALASKHARGGDISQHDLETGIADLQSKLELANSQAGGVSIDDIGGEFDAAIQAINGHVDEKLATVAEAISIHTHTLNLVRDMVRIYGEATANGDVATALAEMNQRLDREITSIRQTREFQAERRARMTAEQAREPEEDPEREAVETELDDDALPAERSEDREPSEKADDEPELFAEREHQQEGRGFAMADDERGR